MAIDINIRITLAAGEQYTDYENGILTAVAGGTPAPAAGRVKAPATTPAETEPEEVQEEEEEEEEAAPKPAPKRARRTKAQIEADAKAAAEAEAEAAEDAEDDAEPEEDLLGTEGSDEDEPTTQDAVDAATVVLTAGGTAKVKAALKTAGVKRVAELTKPADIAAFIADLQK